MYNEKTISMYAKYSGRCRSGQSQERHGVSFMTEIRTMLKGGSLSKTFLIEKKNIKYVRKQIQLEQEREFGFQRWYSQYKRLQRYESQFPNFFPKILDAGIVENTAYFDIEYFENSTNVSDFLMSERNESEVRSIAKTIWDMLATIHSVTYSKNTNASELYLYEKVIRKLAICMENPEFKKFASSDYFVFNGQKVSNFKLNLESFVHDFNQRYRLSEDQQSFVHGNVTLENIIFQPDIGRIIFLDPYEENIIDNRLVDISQLLQSSNSNYEIYNQAQININENTVQCDAQTTNARNFLNDWLKQQIKSSFSQVDIELTYLYEISQYIRMLPFKKQSDPEKCKFFYIMAGKLYDDFKRGI